MEKNLNKILFKKNWTEKNVDYKETNRKKKIEQLVKITSKQTDE